MSKDGQIWGEFGKNDKILIFVKKVYRVYFERLCELYNDIN
jgi:hypothetical protein